MPEPLSGARKAPMIRTSITFDEFREHILAKATLVKNNSGAPAYWNSSQSVKSVFLLSTDTKGKHRVLWVSHKDYNRFPHIRAQARLLCQKLADTDHRLAHTKIGKKISPSKCNAIRQKWENHSQARNKISSRIPESLTTNSPPITLLDLKKCSGKQVTARRVTLPCYNGKRKFQRRVVWMNNDMQPFIALENRNAHMEAKCIARECLGLRRDGALAAKLYDKTVPVPFRKKANVSSLITMFEGLSQREALHASPRPAPGAFKYH